MIVKFEFGDYLTKEIIPVYILHEIERYVYEKNNNIDESCYTFRNIHALIGLAKFNNHIDDNIANEIKIRLSKMHTKEI